MVVLGSKPMNVKTKVRAGRLASNHCPIVRGDTPQEVAMKVKTNVRAGRLAANHCPIVR